VTRYEVLADLIKKHGWTVGAELGVFKGETFFYLLDRFPFLTLVGVDRWKPTSGPKQDRETGQASYERHPMAEYAARVKAMAQAYCGRALIYHMSTLDAAEDIRDESLDFVFIDASHDTESVRADIQAWKQKVKPSGQILGHDINWPSVERAVRAEFQFWRREEANIWAVYREFSGPPWEGAYGV
jgi:hypothetical protein